MKILNSITRCPEIFGVTMLVVAIAATLRAEEKNQVPPVPTSAYADPAMAGSVPIDPNLKANLKLTDAQWSQVLEILKQKEIQINAEMDRHFSAQRVISSKADAKLAEILTEDQITAYFASDRKQGADRLNTVAAEIRKRRELRQQGNPPPEKK